MAQKIQVLLVDDLDGGEASETVTFGLDGVSYEIDLSNANAARLRDEMASWIGHARRTGGRRASGSRSSSSTSSSSSRGDLNKVREWGRANGYTVSDRGRVSKELQEAYDKAQG
ncbi:Lsr2 family protein [Luteipulveratus sp. YIM 133132]|uniref:Lsr2 family protein n=1 Tax=Luteipulveratus flavus TaxID=3031728 RepID=A0ABT6C6Z1_9MICO|nr:MULTISPECIES: Lsr2 family protein [unclassified Luteipulveratus]MDE9364954.1 Lsr2 family protein [Luteipulveratus sp. YIM 133132]MDF8264706.1 Lsr2 family protein [Luteipulveratus sp. YIM 133296]